MPHRIKINTFANIINNGGRQGQKSVMLVLEVSFES